MSFEEEHLKTQRWNKQEKKSNVTFYVLIGILCFVLAWAMSGV